VCWYFCLETTILLIRQKISHMKLLGTKNAQTRPDWCNQHHSEHSICKFCWCLPLETIFQFNISYNYLLLEQRIDNHRTCHLPIRLRAPATRQDEDEGWWYRCPSHYGASWHKKRLEASIAEPKESSAEPSFQSIVALARFPSMEVRTRPFGGAVCVPCCYMKCHPKRRRRKKGSLLPGET